MKRLLFPMIALALTVFLSSCEKDDDDHGDNNVEIVFVSPMSGEQVADAANVVLEIDFTATEELHDTEVYLHAETDPDQLILEKEIHEHEKSYTFMQTVDLSSFPSGTSFLLEVEACVDHDCDEQKEEFIRFTIQ